MAKRKAVKRYKTGSQVSAEKAQSAIDAKNEAASKAASDQSSGGARSNPTKAGSQVSSSVAARAIAEKKAASDQSGRSSAASVTAPSGGRAESRATQAPQVKAGSQVDDSVAQAAIAAKGLPGITEAGGRGRAPSPQGGQLARTELLGRRDFAQTPMYDAAGNIVGQYGGERVSPGGAPAAMTFNPDTGYMVSAPYYYPGDMGMPALPEQEAAFVASRFRPLLEPQVAGQPAATPYSPAGLPNPSGYDIGYMPPAPPMGPQPVVDRLVSAAPSPSPSPAYDPQRMMEINQTPGLGMPGMPTSIVAGMEAPQLAGLRDIRAESNRIVQGLLTPDQAVSPSPAPTPPLPDRSFMGPNTMADRAALSAPPRAVTAPQPAPNYTDINYPTEPVGPMLGEFGRPLGYPDPLFQSPAPAAPQVSPYLAQQFENQALQNDANRQMRPGMSPMEIDEILQGAPVRTTPPAPIPTTVPPDMTGGTTTTAPATSVSPEQIAADTADTAGFRTAAANIARVPGIGPTVAGVLEGIGSAFGDGDGPFGLPANERFTIDDFTEAQREMDRGSDREQRSRGMGAIPFPGKGGGGRRRGDRERAPDNPPYIPPSIPAPVPQTPTPAYQSYNDLMAAAMMGYPIGMAGGGMVRPSMTNAFTPGSYYAMYDPRKRGLGGM